MPLLAWMKKESYTWCKHQATFYHQTRKMVLNVTHTV